MSLPASTPTPTRSSAIPSTELSSLTNVPVTTPFAPPTGCTNIHYLTTLTGRNNNGSLVTTTALVADPSDPFFPSCRPSEWNPSASLSPAVCPGDWTASSMRAMTVSSQLITTAYCCPEIYVLCPAGSCTYESMSVWCTRDIKAAHNTIMTGSLSHGTGPTTTVTAALFMQPPWHISWQASDRSTLSPPPPTLTPGQVIRSWSPPSSTATTRVLQNSYGSTDLYLFEVVGLPIIGVAIVLLAVGCCCSTYGRERRENMEWREMRRVRIVERKERERREREEAELGTTPGSGRGDGALKEENAAS